MVTTQFTTALLLELFADIDLLLYPKVAIGFRHCLCFYSNGYCCHQQFVFGFNIFIYRFNRNGMVGLHFIYWFSLPTFMGIRLGLASIDVMLFGRVQL